LRGSKTSLGSYSRLLFTVAVLGAVLFGGGVALGLSLRGPGQEPEVKVESPPESEEEIVGLVRAETVRKYTLEIVPKDIDYYGGDAVWHAWTFNGTVPGPTLKVNVSGRKRLTLVTRTIVSPGNNAPSVRVSLVA